jgi:hypothetical protein
MFLNLTGHTYPAGFRNTLQPRSHVYTIAKNIAVIDNYIAYVDAYSEFDSTIARYIDVALGNRTLDGNRAAYGINCADEFKQGTVARCLNNATSMLRNLGID